MEHILKLYREEDVFTSEQHELIEDAINSGEIETEDLRIDFKEWVYPQNLGLDMEQVWEFDEHYQNGLTHKQNLEELLSFHSTPYRFVFYHNGGEHQTFIEPNGERTVMSIAMEILFNEVGHTDTSFGLYDMTNNLIFSDEDINEE